MSDPDKVPFFGVDGVTGRPAFQAKTLGEIVELISGKRSAEHEEQQERAAKVKLTKDGLGLTGDVDDPNDLGQTGWAVVFTESVDNKTKAALKKLIDRRKEQIEENRRPEDDHKTLFRDDLVIEKSDAIADVRERWKYAPGPVDPGKVPAYVLLVGPPSDVSFELQHALDVDFFVGRLDLDTPEQYEAYAAALLDAEKTPTRPRSAVYWAPKNPNDKATELSSSRLAKPLADWTEQRKLATVGRAIEDHATKDRLLKYLGTDVPGLLFTAGHGQLMALDHEKQRSLQGALVTNEWPNDFNSFKMNADHMFAASDLPANKTLDGLLAVLFACYGGGTPKKSRFPYEKGEGIRQLASFDFTAALPKAMLARGAGAVVAHVERAWDTGFSWQGIGSPQIDTWTSVVVKLLKGHRVGLAVNYLNKKYTSITAELSLRMLKEEKENEVIPELDRAYLWMQHADARGWIVLGDPAAKSAMKPA